MNLGQLTTELFVATKKSTALSPKKAPAGMKYMQTRLSEDSWTALRMLALEQKKALQQLVLEGLTDLLKKYGKNHKVTGPDSDD
jgi:hypothetical protein